MAAAAASLRHSAALLRHPKPSPPPAAAVSASLRPLPLRRRALTLTSRRRPRGGGATMLASPASSYASALADVAQATNTLEPTLADIEKLDRFFDDPSVKSLFINPTIPVEVKRDFIDQITKSADLQPHTANFLNIIVDMKRTEILKEIVKDFETAYNKITGTEVAVVSSVVQLESEHLAQIAKTVQRFTGAKNVRIKTVIDPSLIAGFTVRYGSSGSKLIDMSVKKQLDEIASQLDFSEISLV